MDIKVPLLKQSDGKPSASFTMVFVTFNVVILWFLLSMFESLGPLKVRAFDAGQAMTVFGPLISLYWGRRYTDSKTQVEVAKTQPATPDPAPEARTQGERDSADPS
jgi:hypothetical protein